MDPHFETSPKPDVLPPEVVASPSALRAAPGEEMTWWRPTWSESLRHVGWRWILLVPVVLLAGGGIFLLLWAPRRNIALLGLELKLVKLSIAIAIPMVLYVFRKA